MKCIQFVRLLIILFFLAAGISLSSQINISQSNGSILGRVSDNTSLSDTVSGYNLGYFSGMQCIGDIDSDQVVDYAVASEIDNNTRPYSSYDEHRGVVYVFFGRKGTDANAFWNTKNMGVEEKADMVLVTNLAGWLGWHIAGLGDINGDGKDDFAIGCSNAGATSTHRGEGALFVLLGRGNRAAWKLNDQNDPNNVNPSQQNMGTIPASSLDAAQKAKYKVLFRYDNNGFYGIYDYNIHATLNAYTMFGRNFGKCGDIDRDGINDMIIGEAGYSGNGKTDCGKVYILKGAPKSSPWIGVGQNGKLIVLNDNNNTVPFVSYSGNISYEALGYAATGVGDMNMDGIDDVCFGGDNSDDKSAMPSETFTEGGVTYQSIPSKVYTRNRGRAYMVFGSTSFFNNWQSNGSKTTSNANVTFIGGYTSTPPDINDPNYRMHSHGLGTIIARGGKFCPNPNFTGLTATKTNPRLLNCMLLSEPMHDHGSTSAQNYGLAYIFYAKTTWASVYDFLSPGAYATWKYSAVFNYGDVADRYANHSTVPFGTGFGLQGVGDVNRDGFDDIIISNHYDANSDGIHNLAQNPRASTLFYGGATLAQLTDHEIHIKDEFDNTTPPSPLQKKVVPIIAEMYPFNDKKETPDPPNPPIITPADLQTSLCQASGPGDINGDGMNDLVMTSYLQPGNVPVDMDYKSNNVNGSGKVYIKLQAASGVDLWGKDHKDDPGTEPNPMIEVFNSPDIWNRVNFGSNTTPTLITTTISATEMEPENPDPAANLTPNHALVNVRNGGAQKSDAGVWKVCLYWTLAATGETWPDKWNGSRQESISPCNPPQSAAQNRDIGNFIGSYTLPAIDGNSIITIDFPWQPPAPNQYGTKYATDNCTKLNVCLLARIVYSVADEVPTAPEPASVTGLHTGEEGSLGFNVRQNNNIYTRNLMIEDKLGNGIVEKTGRGGSIRLQNEYAFTTVNTLSFRIDESTQYNNLYALGSNSYYSFALPDAMYSAWVSGGSLGDSVVDLQTIDTEGLHLIKITSDEANLQNIEMPSGTEWVAGLKYTIDAEYEMPEGFYFKNRLHLLHQCDMNDERYINSLKEQYLTDFGSHLEDLGGCTYDLIIH